MSSARLDIFAKAFAPVAEHPSKALAIPSFTGSSAAFAAATLAMRAPADRPPLVLAVAPGLPEADALLWDLRALEKESGVRTLDFPPASAGDRAASASRLRTAAALGAYAAAPYPLVVAASAAALEGDAPAPGEAASATIRLAPADGRDGGGDTAALSFAEIRRRLAAAGYERCAEVVSPGCFAVRGGVLDVWAPGEERPVRAEFFGDILESLRSFDPGSQTSTGKLDSAGLPPVEMPSGGTCRFWDLLPHGFAAIWLEHNACPGAAHVPVEAAKTLFTGDPAPRGVPTYPFQTFPLPGFSGLGTEAVRNPELLDVARSRLAAHLDALRKRKYLVSEDNALSGGFEVEGLAVSAKSDRIFAHRRASGPRGRSIAAGERLEESAALEPGELVVHLDYGIGRFAGSTEIEVGGKRSEVFTIEYADGAKLHVPVAHSHLLSRYVGVKGETPRLHRLDGKRWNREKDSAHRAVRDLAASLLETQARRAVAPGFASDTGAPEVAAFEAAFPWEETPDQARAIEDVKNDMAATRPMDRLVCGDAGYGKTEVAMRAAFIAAVNGRQTALLAPTTVLAEQHYETFLARFEGTPVRIEAFSRFQSPAALEAARQRIASGASDIAIGTHALVSGKMKFRNLGLVVIDEEQRFGVRQKEWLKKASPGADVLTLSATPIPRTLYLSMTGARDLSVLKTPPQERVSVETAIERRSDRTVREAIERELRRGGQVFYVHNRVFSIRRKEAELHALVPEAKIETAHGQMESAALAAKMQRFAHGGADILLCTTIVESGLDIPRANTIIVERADCFGMAELYQLRGRVGRSSRQGYALFLLPEDGLVDSDARARLNALRRHSGAGAGFGIAMRDLEIRGAGNLLGSEQSGHIAAVGFSLYCQLLKRAIARMKGEEAAPVADVSLNLDFLDFSPGSASDADGACLPYDYVEDDAQRMAFHRRLAETSTLGDVRSLRKELADRYGRLPRAAQRLVRLAELRVKCSQAGFASVDVRDGRAVFRKAGAGGGVFAGRLQGATADMKIASLARLAAKFSAGC